MSQKDWIEKDYYSVLGLKKDATEDQIKKAFRKLAREYHPDQNQDPAAEKKFKDITEAHDVIGDPKTRREYDETRSLYGSPGFRFPGGMGGGAGINLDDLLNAAGSRSSSISDLFSGFFNQTPGAGARSPRRGSNVETTAKLSFRDAAHGTTVTVRVSSETACSSCRGTGAKAGTTPKACGACQGSGMTNTGSFAFSEPCTKCHGRGLIIDNPCPTCHGTGQGVSKQGMQVRIPAGVQDGQRIRVAGKGAPGSGGGQAGDLFVVIAVTPDPVFSRQGEHLAITVPITFPEAALGAEISVPSLDGGQVRLRIPAGTKSGRTFRAKGKGIEHKSGMTDLL
ncbi:MAG: DnaJ domain-containing protein, partial [Propionibacteriaceae bacterium]|nr:DnaJ domain-containing protein [Propionibacteriaceae bacterium]